MKLKTLLTTLALTITSLLPTQASEERPIYLIPVEELEIIAAPLQQNTLAEKHSWAMGGAAMSEEQKALMNPMHMFGIGDPVSQGITFILKTCHSKAGAIRLEDAYLNNGVPEEFLLAHGFASLDDFGHYVTQSHREADDYYRSEILPHLDEINALVFSKLGEDYLLKEDYGVGIMTGFCPTALQSLSKLFATQGITLSNNRDIRELLSDYVKNSIGCGVEPQETYTELELSALSHMFKICEVGILTDECTGLVYWSSGGLSEALYTDNIKTVFELEAPTGLPLSATIAAGTIPNIRHCLEAEGYTVLGLAEYLQNFPIEDNSDKEPEEDSE